MTTLYSLLEEIKAGTTTFKPASENEADMLDFQPIARMLAYANGEGLLNSFELQRENQSGNRWCDLVLVSGGLSYKGERFLGKPSAETETAERALESIPWRAGMSDEFNDDSTLRRAIEYIGVSPVLERFGAWVVTTYGVECLQHRYCIEFDRVEELDWIARRPGSTSQTSLQLSDTQGISTVCVDASCLAGVLSTSLCAMGVKTRLRSESYDTA